MHVSIDQPRHHDSIVTCFNNFAAGNDVSEIANSNDLLILNVNRSRTNAVTRHYCSPTND